MGGPFGVEPGIAQHYGWPPIPLEPGVFVSGRWARSVGRTARARMASLHPLKPALCVSARERLQLRPGQKMQVMEYEGRAELIPERDIRELRGFVKGIDTEFEREGDRV